MSQTGNETQIIAADDVPLVRIVRDFDGRASRCSGPTSTRPSWCSGSDRAT